MNKLTLTLLSAVAAGIITPALLSARAGDTPTRRMRNTNAPVESVAKRYPLLGRTITGEHSSSLLKAPNLSLSPSTRFNAPVKRGAAPVQMMGNVVSARNWDSRYNGYGLYEILAGTEIETTLKLKGSKTAPNSNAGGVLVGDKFFSTYWYEGWGMVLLDLTVYDVNNWETIGTYYLEPEEGEIGYIASDMAYNPESQTVYGCFYNNYGTGYELATIKYYQTVNEYYGEDYYDATKTTIGAVSNRVIALGVTSDDQLYGVMEDGCFYKFDSKTAEATLIGDTGLKIASSQGIYPQSGAIDQHNGKFYWASVDMNGNSVLYTVDTNDAHLEKVADFPNAERVYGLTCLPHSAADGAPNYLSDFGADFKDADLTGTVTFTLPEDNYDGSEGASSLMWHILANSKEVANGTGAAGETITATVTVEGGQTQIETYSENSEGKSPYSSIDLWIGEDVPVMRKAEFAYVNNVATVNWSLEALGAHGGHVGTVTYDVVRMPSEETVASAVTETIFTETLTNEMPLGNYYYIITPTNSGLKGEGMATGKVIIGQSIVPPYLETFDTPESLDLYTIIGKDWSWETRTYSSDNGVVNCEEGSSWGSDDDANFVRAYAEGVERSKSWLITPEIKVEAGKTYDIRLKSWAVFGDKFEIWYGPGLDPSKYSLLMPATEGFGDSSFSEEHVLQLKADKTENIHLGFVHVGMFDSFLRIDDLTILAGTGASSPAAITDLEIIPEEKGGKSATITFTAPENDQEGNALNKLDHIDILIGNDIIKTFENPTPGAKLEYTYIADNNGYFQFRVEAYSDGNMAPVVEKKVYIGVDVPKAPAATIVDMGDHIEVQWEVASTGENGEYVNPDGVYYALFQMDDDGYVDIYNPVAADLQGSSCAFDFDPNEGEQGFLQLIICAYNDAGMSGMRYTSALLVGEAYDLPFTDGFREDIDHPWVINSESDCFGFSTSHFSDGDGSSWGWAIVEGEDHTESIETGKISCGGDENLRVSFDYITNAGNIIEVYAIYPDGSEKLIGTASEESTGMNNDWKKSVFEIPDSNGDRNVRIRFTFVNNSGSIHYMHLDNIQIDKNIEHDIRIEASLMKGQATVGETAVIAATVRNLGLNPAEGVALNFYVNGNLTETKAISSIAPMAYETVYFNYLLTPSTTGRVLFTVEADYELDEREEDNEADVVLQVALPVEPAPENLNGNMTSEGMVLTWDAPARFQVETVVEDFEDYEPFSIDEMGEWTLVDADGRNTMVLTGLSYPNNGSKMAYMVFNPTKVILPDETVGLPQGNTEAYAYDGNQYLISVATVLDNMDDHNDDWLISPELSGNAQTVSFFAKQMINYYGPESCEVLYSTSNTTDIADFQLLESFEIDNPVAWTEFAVELPEGAKRFAIRVTTARGHIFMLDHITYEKGTTRVVTGYNIYRDEVKIGQVAHDVTTFTDAASNGNHTYAVTALYASGNESGYSNLYYYETGVALIESDTIYDVVTVDGIVMKRLGRELKDLPKGIYMVNGRKYIAK